MSRSGTCFTHNAAEIPRLLSPDPGVVKGSRALFSQEDLPRPTHVTSLDIWQLFVVVLLETRGCISLTLRTNGADYDSPRSAAGEV